MPSPSPLSTHWIEKAIEKLAPAQAQERCRSLFEELKAALGKKAYPYVLASIYSAQLSGQRPRQRAPGGIRAEWVEGYQGLEKLVEKIRDHSLVRWVNLESVAKAIVLYEPREFYCSHHLIRKHCVTKGSKLKQFLELQRESDRISEVWKGSRTWQGRAVWRRLVSTQRKRLRKLRAELSKLEIDPVVRSPEDYCTDEIPKLEDRTRVRLFKPQPSSQLKAGAPIKDVQHRLLETFAKHTRTKSGLSGRKASRLLAMVLKVFFTGYEERSQEDLAESMRRQLKTHLKNSSPD